MRSEFGGNLLAFAEQSLWVSHRHRLLIGAHLRVRGSYWLAPAPGGRENPEGALAEASTLSGFSSLLESSRGPNSGRELPLAEASGGAILNLHRSCNRCNPSVRSFPRLRGEVCKSLNSPAV